MQEALGDWRSRKAGHHLGRLVLVMVEGRFAWRLDGLGKGWSQRATDRRGGFCRRKRRLYSYVCMYSMYAGLSLGRCCSCRIYQPFLGEASEVPESGLAFSRGLVAALPISIDLSTVKW